MAITKQTARESTLHLDSSSSQNEDTPARRKIKRPLPTPWIQQRLIQQRNLPPRPAVTLPADAITPDPVKEARAIKIFFVQQLDALKDGFLRELEQRDERQGKGGIDFGELKPVIEDVLAETAEEMVSDITEQVEEVVESQGEDTKEEIVDAIQQLEGRLVDKINVVLVENNKALQGWFADFLQSKGRAFEAQESVVDASEQPKLSGQQPTAATTNTIDQFRLLFPQPTAATTDSLEEFKRLFPQPTAATNSIDEFKRLFPQPTAATTDPIDQFKQLFPLPEHTYGSTGQSSLDEFRLFFPLPAQKSGGTGQQPSSSKNATTLDAVAGASTAASQGQDRQLTLATTQGTQRQSSENAKLVQSNEELARANSKLVEANSELVGANAALSLANDELVDANTALALTNDKFSHTNEALALANQELVSSNKDLAQRNSKLEQTNHALVVENAKLLLQAGALKRGRHDDTKGFEERVKRVDERFAADRKQVEDIGRDVEEIKGVLDRDRKHKLESRALFEKLFPEHGQGASAAGPKTVMGSPFQVTSRGAVAGEKEWEKLENSGGSEGSASGSIS